MASYVQACSRDQCGIKETLPAINRGQFDYHMNTSAFIHPDAMAMGSIGALGRIASDYGAVRKTVTDPVLFHRSNLSSACPPNALTQAGGQGLLPVDYNAPQAQVLNKGASIFTYQTRNQLISAQLKENHISANYPMGQPNRRNIQWTGFFGIPGTNMPSRQMSLCANQSRFIASKDQGCNRGHYASYGVF